MKLTKEKRIFTAQCTVVTKLKPHPFHCILDVESLDEVEDVKSHLHKAYAKGMEPIIKACDTARLKNEITQAVAFARFKNITLVENTSKVYELEEEE